MSIKKRKIGLGIVSILTINLIMFILAPNQQFIKVKTDEVTPRESENVLLPPGNTLVEQKAPTFEEMTKEEQQQLLETLPEGATLVDSDCNPIDTSLN